MLRSLPRIERLDLAVVSLPDELVAVAHPGVDDFRTDVVDSIRRIKSLRPQVVHFAHCASHRHPLDEPPTG